MLSLYHRVEDRSVHRIEIHVDTLGRDLAQTLLDGFRTVIDAGVEVRFLHTPVALFRSTRDADYATSFDPCDLPRHGTQGAGRAGDQYGFALLDLRNVQHSIVGGEAGNTHHP